MLFLRRCAGESLTLVGPQGFYHTIQVRMVNARKQKARITFYGTDGLESRTLARGDSLELFQGIRISLSFVVDFQGIYPDAASLGIEAPRKIKIFRTEKLTGLGPDQVRAIGK